MTDRQERTYLIIKRRIHNDYILSGRCCYAAAYSRAGVREYWIVDPVKERVTVYHYEDDAAPVIYTFTQNVPVGIYPGLTLRIADLIG